MFHNPYSFVPAPKRDHATGGLADGPPVGHDRFHDGRFTGGITVKMTVASPLLIPDSARAKPLKADDPNGHKTYPLRLGPDGLPQVPATSIKGMLRAAYEAVTNSRLSVFSPRHSRRLARRMSSNEGLSLVPARIERGAIHLMLGTNSEIPFQHPDLRWDVPGRLMYAAWLPSYFPVCDINTGYILEWTNYFADPIPLRHGQPVRVDLQKIRRSPFYYWRVTRITLRDCGYGPIDLPSELWDGHVPCPGDVLYGVDGYVCVTNHNIQGKHDERVFFDRVNSGSSPVSLEERHQSRWRELIENYQVIHQRELDRGIHGPPASPLSRWSRQIVGGASEAELGDGTLCYARVARDGHHGYRVIALLPVMISRDLHRVSPASLLPDSLQPAQSVQRLSPADRVFGWVRQRASAEETGGSVTGPGGHRGQLRVCRVRCLTPASEAIEPFGKPGLPVAILGEPKSQQARFYMAEDQSGGHLHSDQTPAYEEGRGLRGRKVYPHHNDLDEQYWHDALTDRTQECQHGHYQEYARPEAVRDEQNRSVQGWIRRGTVFQFDIDVTNLSDVELGALLFLLRLPDEQPSGRKPHHRLGGGKPLGFGSVRLEIQSLDLQDGAALAQGMGL